MEVGDIAPDFTLPDDEGTPRSLSGLLADGPVVLFDYPLLSDTGGVVAEQFDAKPSWLPVLPIRRRAAPAHVARAARVPGGRGTNPDVRCT